MIYKFLWGQQFWKKSSNIIHLIKTEHLINQIVFNTSIGD